VEHLVQPRRAGEGKLLIKRNWDLNIVLEALIRTAALIHVAPGLSHHLTVSRHGFRLDEASAVRSGLELLVTHSTYPVGVENENPIR
jgi:hypothetical protein